MFPNSMKALAALTTLLLMAWPAVACACKCGPTSGFYPFDLPFIFVGKVATVERVDVDPKTGYETFTKACLDSEFSLYGVPADNPRVCVVTDNSDCRSKFQVGEHYMVFAETKVTWKDFGLPYTDQCLGTNLLRPQSTSTVRSTTVVTVLVASIVSFVVGFLIRGLRRK